MTSTETTTTTPVANLAAARKAQASAKKAARANHPAGTAKKVAAKKVTRAKAAAESVAKTAYVATSRSGKVSTREFATPMLFAVDVSDADAKSEAGRKGLIWAFYATKELADAAAERTNAKEGLNAKVVAARKA